MHSRERKVQKEREKVLPDIKSCWPSTIINVESRFFFFSCGRAGQFSQNYWAVWWSGRNSTAITCCPVSCPITERFGGEATKFDTFDQTFPAICRSFHPERDMPRYGGNNNNFLPPVSGLMPQKAPAYCYWCYGEMLHSNTLSPGLVGSVINGNYLGHLPFFYFTWCYHFLFLVGNCKENPGLFLQRGEKKDRERQGLAQHYPVNQWHIARSLETWFSGTAQRKCYLTINVS